MELIHCHGYIYAERPEEWSPSNPHPRNFSNELDRRVTMDECTVEHVTDEAWRWALKFYFYPNYVDY